MESQANHRLVALTVCCVSVTAVIPTAARAELIYGITWGGAGEPQTLVKFDSHAPEDASTVAPLTGMPAGHIANAMDFRPATGQLYIGASGPDGRGGFAAQPYTVDLSTGAMTPVGSPFDPAAASAGVPSMDFDPVRDELRVLTTPTDRPLMTNTRWDSDTFVFISQDTPLEFVADGPGMFFNPPVAIGAAYSNNFAGATSTTLYAYEMQTDFVVTVGGIDGSPSADSGQMLVVGESGFVVPGTIDLGFDISGPTGVAYVSTLVEELPGVRLFTMDLDTGAMSDLGEIVVPGGARVIDISVSVPEPTPLMAVASAASLNLLRRRRRSRRR